MSRQPLGSNADCSGRVASPANSIFSRDGCPAGRERQAIPSSHGPLLTTRLRGFLARSRTLPPIHTVVCQPPARPFPLLLGHVRGGIPVPHALLDVFVADLANFGRGLLSLGLAVGRRRRLGFLRCFRRRWWCCLGGRRWYRGLRRHFGIGNRRGCQPEQEREHEKQTVHGAPIRLGFGSQIIASCALASNQGNYRDFVRRVSGMSESWPSEKTRRHRHRCGAGRLCLRLRRSRGTPAGRRHGPRLQHPARSRARAGLAELTGTTCEVCVYDNGPGRAPLVRPDGGARR